jgi:hypothetical protein
MKALRVFYIGGVSFLFIGIQSCVKDTCNNELGSTFKNIEINQFEYTVGDPVLINLELETLSELPNDYFQAVIMGNEQTTEQITSVNGTSTEIIFQMQETVLPDSGETVNYALSFEFGDRRDYINCHHPGSADRYYLELVFQLNRPDDERYELVNYAYKEVFLAGHL